MSKLIVNFICMVSILILSVSVLVVQISKADAAGSSSDDLSRIHAGTAWEAYNRGDLKEAERQFRLLIDMDYVKTKGLEEQKKLINLKTSKELINLKLGLGYTLYQQEKYEAAYDLIDNCIRNSVVRKNDIKNGYNDGGLDELKLNNSQIGKLLELKQILCFKLSDPAVSDAKKGRYAAFYGYDNTIYHRHKNGDNGTSRLDETSVSINFIDSSKIALHQDISADIDSDVLLKSRYLSNGGYSSVRDKWDIDNTDIRTGSYYRNLNGQNPIRTSKNDRLVLHEAQIKISGEQEFMPFDLGIFPSNFNIVPFDIEVVMGISPVGGAVDPTPVFEVAVELKNRWKADIHRLSVNDSILSISGLEDSYREQNLYSSNSYYSSQTDNEWGRVVKNGITLGKDISFGKNNWLSINGSFDLYRGHNVLHNSGLQLNTAAGRTITAQNGDQFTFGIYASCMLFEQNSNFYTYGHGGYYSPDFMLAAGPLFRYKRASCRDYWIDAQFSVGLMAEDNSDAPKYPIHYEVIDEFTKEAVDELQGVYRGDSSVGVSGSMKIEGWKIIRENLSAGSFLSMNAASDDFEWYLGGVLKYSFNGKNLFLK